MVTEPEPGFVWRPISEAPKRFIRFGEGTDDGTWNSDWLLLGRRDKRGWVEWVGSLDADSWLGRSDDRACWECEPPTHWSPLPAPPTTAKEPR